ncbi:MAG: ABC transporter permease [Chloroflexota bacterium]|nr:ABC transporter permease [Chloroflexota bacterium]
MNELRGVYIIWYRDLLRFWRDRIRLFTAFIQPLFFLIIFGTGLSSSMALVSQQSEDYDYIQFMFPGVIAMIVLFTAIMWGISIVWDREFGFLKEVLVAPVSRVSVAIGKALGGATIATIQGTMMLVFAPIAGVNLSMTQVIPLLILMFIIAVSLTSMGILVASRVKTMESFQIVMQLLLFPLLFISPALFPVDQLPAWLGWMVRVNPVSYAVDSLRQVVLSHTEGGYPATLELFGHNMSVAEDALVILLFGVIMVTLAVRSFGRQE